MFAFGDGVCCLEQYMLTSSTASEYTVHSPDNSHSE